MDTVAKNRSRADTAYGTLSESALRALLDGRVNASLKAIFAFYRWAEESKRVRFQVGIYAEGELPAAHEAVAFPISAKRNFTKGRHGSVHGAWTTPLTSSESGKGARLRHTPMEDEIRNLHEVAVEHEHGERDSLLFFWAEEAGPRRAEILRLGKSHMPGDSQLASLIERDESWLITITRKGGVSKPIHAPADLIIRTLDFIQFGRRDIVERCQKNIAVIENLTRYFSLVRPVWFCIRIA